jgi:hypothetical protein
MPLQAFAFALHMEPDERMQISADTNIRTVYGHVVGGEWAVYQRVGDASSLKETFQEQKL